MDFDVIVILGTRPTALPRDTVGSGHLAGWGSFKVHLSVWSQRHYVRYLAGQAHISKAKNAFHLFLIQLELVPWRFRLAVCVSLQKSLVASLLVSVPPSCGMGEWCAVIW